MYRCHVNHSCVCGAPQFFVLIVRGPVQRLGGPWPAKELTAYPMERSLTRRNRGKHLCLRFGRYGRWRDRDAAWGSAGRIMGAVAFQISEECPPTPLLLFTYSEFLSSFFFCPVMLREKCVHLGTECVYIEDNSAVWLAELCWGSPRHDMGLFWEDFQPVVVVSPPQTALETLRTPTGAALCSASKSSLEEMLQICVLIWIEKLP
jgi:hypothetical protein